MGTFNEGGKGSYIHHPIHGCVIEGYLDTSSFRVTHGGAVLGVVESMAEAVALAKTKSTEEASVFDDSPADWKSND